MYGLGGFAGAKGSNTGSGLAMHYRKRALVLGKVGEGSQVRYRRIYDLHDIGSAMLVN